MPVFYVRPAQGTDTPVCGRGRGLGPLTRAPSPAVCGKRSLRGGRARAFRGGAEEWLQGSLGNLLDWGFVSVCPCLVWLWFTVGQIQSVLFRAIGVRHGVWKSSGPGYYL